MFFHWLGKQQPPFLTFFHFFEKINSQSDKSHLPIKPTPITLHRYFNLKANT